MNPIVYNLDKLNYVYMVDINDNKRLFAVTRSEYVKFKSYYDEYKYYPDILKMPETTTIYVYPLVEISDNIFELREKVAVQYPVKWIYIAIVKNYTKASK